jgi:hypothetical protein
MDSINCKVTFLLLVRHISTVSTRYSIITAHYPFLVISRQTIEDLVVLLKYVFFS